MDYTYDPATDGGRVRLLTSDTAVGSADLRIFSDQEIAAFLAMAGSSVLAAAAFALESIAASEVLIQKRIRLLDLTTDGPAEADALRLLAASYRARADAGDGADGTGFEIAEMVVDQHAADESEWNRRLATG